MIETVKLTGKEMEVMKVLWDSKTPMTATELIEDPRNRTWKENSIYVLLNTLIKKGAIAFACNKPSNTRNAKAYQPMLTPEAYAVAYVRGLSKIGVNIDTAKFLKSFTKAEKEG